MKTAFSIIFLLLISIVANAQTDSTTVNQIPKKSLEVKSILSLKLGITDPLVAISYERLFSDKFGAEVAVGVLGISIGPKFYIPSIRPNKVNFHTGLIVGSGYFAQGMYTYLPIGINRLTRNNFMLSFDLGPQYLVDGEEFLPGMSFKIGKAF